DGLHARIVADRSPYPLRHAKGREGRLLRPRLGEEGVVDDIGPGVAALDVVDADLFEQAGYADLVLERELDAGGLRAVSQRGVEQVEAVLAHWAVLGRLL